MVINESKSKKNLGIREIKAENLKVTKRKVIIRKGKFKKAKIKRIITVISWKNLEREKVSLIKKKIKRNFIIKIK